MALLLLLMMGITPLHAQQRFFNLTAKEVKVDTIMPHFLYSIPLPAKYADSTYTVTVKYPEYIDMTQSDIAAYNRLSGAALPSQVTVEQYVSSSRGQAYLVVSFCPLVFRDNRYQALVSFMLDIKARSLKSKVLRQHAAIKAQNAATSVYADHSVLSTGKWAKIRVSETGVHQLTESVIKQAGFTDINKVKIYGYGGNLQREALYADDLRNLDDLQEVSQCVVGGKHLFYAKGPVSWASATTATRTRNPYSDYGYYFITQSDSTPITVDSATFVGSFYPAPSDYHSLYEDDSYSWYKGGRNLFSSTAITPNNPQKIILTNVSEGTSGRLTVSVTAGVSGTEARVLRGSTELGRLNITVPNYCSAGQATATYNITDMTAGEKDTITIESLSNNDNIRLDYVSMAWNSPTAAPRLSAQQTAATFAGSVANQDLHASGQADLVIIIPSSGRLLYQAQRLKQFHEEHDSMRVNLVTAEQLYNEFSSGTPDANAYRRYLRMLQDRANGNEADMPKNLLLFGNSVWDNRMLTSDCRNLSPDDYLLAFESENSFSHTASYVSDSWYGILSEGAGLNPTRELQDVGVGRFPVTTADEAKIMVDKTINYAQNSNAGSWHNTLVFMGDDGNDNVHMEDVNRVADNINTYYPDFLIKKIMWDAYTRETSSTGNTYPEVAKTVKQLQSNGVLVMDYAGHGSATQLSHENVLNITDFGSFRGNNLSLWVTAACDVMPFDNTDANIGTTALLNENGGAIAFYGTTRTVFTNYNKYTNHAFMKRVLSLQANGKPTTLGEAHRLSQNDVMLGNNKQTSSTGQTTTETDITENHLQYALLGDPALALNIPTLKVVVDSINGIATASDTYPTVKAGSVTRVKGHIEGAANFNGILTTTVRDTRELITCKLNDTSTDGAETAFTYYDRPKTLYQGSDSVRAGKFDFVFATPMDINYADAEGLINLYANDAQQSLLANGSSAHFLVGGSEKTSNDSIGPSIYCYLNSPSFTDGGSVNTTPFFVAEVKDKDGINASGSGIGHDLQLIIDGDMTQTYNLNDNFSFDFGTYTSGTTYYSIPELSEGNHTLKFRAWDILNNSSTAELNFRVVKGLEPQLFDVNVTNNPARTSTSFIISHDRTESNIDIILEIFDSAGRKVWQYSESGSSNSGSYIIPWDLSVDGGRPLQTGVYIYRVKLASEGSNYTSKTKKLIVVRN